MNQPDLFSAAEAALGAPKIVVAPGSSARAARAARDEAVERVRSGNSAAYARYCAAIAETLAEGAETFTTDDLWRRVDLRDGEEPRVMGAALSDYRRSGIIAKTGEYRPSARPACHARPVAIWRRSR